MKFLLFLCFIFPLFANFNVDVQQDEDFVSIYLETFKEEPSICPLIIYSLEIKHPMPAQKGQIILTVGPDLAAYHLPAFGKRKGSFVFEKGECLPSLKDGSYLLKINSKVYGVIHVGK